MKIFLTVATIATLMTGVAFAEDAANVNSVRPISMSFVTDTSYSKDSEQIATKFGVIAGIRNIELSVLPTYNWDITRVTDIEVGVSYTVNVMNNISVTTYGELHYDNNWARSAEVVGVKTRFNFLRRIK